MERNIITKQDSIFVASYNFNIFSNRYRHLPLRLSGAEFKNLVPFSTVRNFDFLSSYKKLISFIWQYLNFVDLTITEYMDHKLENT